MGVRDDKGRCAVTLSELSQLKYKKRELIIIQDKIEELYERLESYMASPCMAMDTVQSAAEFPYSKHAVKICGVNTATIEKITRRIERLKARQRKLEEDIERAEDFIDSLKDSQLRQIIELRFMQGMSWNMVSSRVYDYPDGDRARKKVDRYFKKI